MKKEMVLGEIGRMEKEGPRLCLDFIVLHFQVLCGGHD